MEELQNQRELSLDVINPGGKDATQDFSGGPPSPSVSAGHPPVNYHAYAACTGGRFTRRMADIQAKVVLVLLRGNLSDSLQVGKKFVSRRIPFLISWKEAGYHQVAQSLSHTRVFTRFMEIGRMATGFLASTPWLLPVYRAVHLTLGEFIPTPYPLDFKEWDFRLPIRERSGIFLGTREFFVPSRNHAAAVLSACELASQLRMHVTCINTEGSRGYALLRSIDAGRGVLQIIQGRLAYSDYLRLIAQHKLVLQFDRSGVPGQVAGDAVLCGVPSLGGGGALDNLLSSVYPASRKDFEETIAYASRLLTSLPLYTEVIAALHQRALETVSFVRCSEALRKLAKEAIRQL
ncbi:hypothetical protein [Candidatus Xiphinematobacter sp. Idaho Grape]|uniref:hypothetical protein n=1 Tax=Candidatus Xiphinematobacter sp. Idaho Grape TaxID=1704307 RepID=UPI0007808AEF|nr:hypothetical protein [Candidatus Xiphinematobacter sp. Idaho Grape]